MDSQAASPRSSHRISFRQALAGLLAGLILLGPLAALTWQAVEFLASGGEAWEVLLPGGRELGLLLQSVLYAGGVALSGLVLAVLTAAFFWRLQKGWARRLRWLFLALASLPPTLHALAWISAGGWLNGLLANTGLEPLSLRGWGWAVWVQLMSYLPLTVGLALVGLDQLPAGLWDAARLTTAPLRAFWRVALPQAGPFLLSAAGLIFLLSLTDFSIPSLFQVNVYSLEIFAEFSASASPARAFLSAVPLGLLTLLAAVFTGRQVRRMFSVSSARQPAIAASAWPAWWEQLQVLAVFTLAVQVILPAVALFTLALPLPTLINTIAAAAPELVTSGWQAVLAGLGCLPLAWWIAGLLDQPGRRGTLAWAIMALVLALPAPLVGIGLIAFWNFPSSPVYGTSLMPLLALVIRWTPYAAIVLLAQRRRVDRGLMDAEQVFRTSRLKSWLWVRLPMFAPGLLAGCFLTIALSLGELGATLLVLPPGVETLPVRLYNFLHFGAAQAVAGLGLVTALAGLLAGAGLVWSFNRLSPRSQGEDS